jgi:hypothetical protein
MLKRLCQISLFGMMVATGATPGAAEQCADAPVDVASGSIAEFRLACSAAKDALRLLARCNISPRARIQIAILKEVIHPQGGAIFGMFDPFRRRALVTQQSNIPTLVKGTPYEALPQAAFYESLIVHEAVHAVMHQNMSRPGASHAAHEYPAYALQIESLSESVRQQFLQSFDQNAIRSKTMFSDAVLFFDPYFFAAHAYQHFKAAGDGCAYLQGLLEGDVAFIAPPIF